MANDYSPAYLRGVHDAVTQFRQLMVEFLALHTEVDPTFAQGLPPAIFAKKDADQDEIARLRRELGKASGKSSEATVITDAGIHVDGVKGLVDPILNWRFMTGPKPIVRPTDVLDTTDFVLGRLEAMIEKAEAELPPSLGPTQLHPLIWGAVSKLWKIGEYRRAVAAACDVVEQHGRSITKRHDIQSGSGMWQQAFSPNAPKPGQPRLRWPGDPSHVAVKGMNDGLVQFAPGVQMTIRNQSTHGQGAAQYTEQEALERLAALSLLTRWVDTCDLVEADTPSANSGSASAVPRAANDVSDR